MVAIAERFDIINLWNLDPFEFLESSIGGKSTQSMVFVLVSLAEWIRVKELTQRVLLANDFILGEFRRTLDDRFRLTVPSELMETLGNDSTDVILTKERPGCLSLWNAEKWQQKLDTGVDLVKSKINAGRLDGRLQEVQLLGRLLSTRHRTVQLAARSRLLIPEGFREFLGVEAGGDVLVIGAAVCLEIWRPDRWIEHLDEKMGEFQNLFDTLSA